jgi:hypothetical protein
MAKKHKSKAAKQAAAPRAKTRRAGKTAPKKAPRLLSGLTPQQEAHARIVGAFAAAVPFTADRIALQKYALFHVAAIIGALAVDAGSETDWGVLIRFNDLRTEPDRVRVRDCVDEALRNEDQPWTSPTGKLVTRVSKLRFLLSEIDPRFSKLTDAEIEKELAKPGRRGPNAIAACLSIACNAFGDRGSNVKDVTERYRKAREALIKHARRGSARPPKS